MAQLIDDRKQEVDELETEEAVSEENIEVAAESDTEELPQHYRGKTPVTTGVLIRQCSPSVLISLLLAPRQSTRAAGRFESSSNIIGPL